MKDIYDKFDAATRDMTAQALLMDGKAVGRIVIKFGAAATAYVQIWGAPMATGRATGYGYDKASAAVMAAIRAFPSAPSERDLLASKAHRAIYLAADTWDGGS